MFAKQAFKDTLQKLVFLKKENFQVVSIAA